MAGWPWPRQFTAHPCTKSRYVRPSSSRSQEPLPSTIRTDGRFVIFMTCVVGLVIMPNIVSDAPGGGKSNIVIFTISDGRRICGTHENRGRRYHDIIATKEAARVAQLIVRNLEDSVKEKLRRRAARRRRSLEAEVRDILCDAVARPASHERHLGTRIAARFLGPGANLDVSELRGHTPRPARFKK